MRHRLFLHIAWTTRGRAALIDARVAAFLTRYLSDVAAQERVRVLALGMVSSHVHMLVRVHPQTSLSRLMQRLKGGSAAIATREGHALRDRELRWARGYSAHSVSQRAVEIVRDYVLSQAEHHPTEAILGWESRPTPGPH